MGKTYRRGSPAKHSFASGWKQNTWDKAVKDKRKRARSGRSGNKPGSQKKG